MHAFELGRVLVISPHLDDAVFACGELLAKCLEAVAVTVFAGIPPRDDELTPWDRACGFSGAVEAMICRRREDQMALEHLGVRHLWLHFLDSQYGATPSEPEIVDELVRAVSHERPDSVLMPMGLYHSDHELAHSACLAVRRLAPAQRWLFYEDAIYRRHAGLLQKRLADLWKQGITVTPALTEPVRGDKQAAVRYYASQMKALGPQRWQDAERPEHYWQLDEESA